LPRKWARGSRDEASKRGCDLALMAAHRRTGVKALVLGSETQNVLTYSKIPVLVYRRPVTMDRPAMRAA